MTEERAKMDAQQAHYANELAHERDGNPISKGAATDVASDCSCN
jgi:hypothetical protein